MGINAGKLQDTFAVNRGYIEFVTTKIIEMQTIKFDALRKNFYSHIFDISASILSIRDRVDLDNKVSEVEKKYNLSLRALENIIWLFGNWSPHKRAVIKVRIPHQLEGQWDKIEKRILNWHNIENDLRKIMFWVNLKVQGRASALGIDFSKIAEMTKTAPSTTANYE